MPEKNVIDLTTTTTTSGTYLEITVPNGLGDYASRKISFAIVKDAVNLQNSTNKGYFTTPTALREAFPVGENGWFAIVGSTDTVWIWDDGTVDWIDTTNSGLVLSVNGLTGAVVLEALDIDFASAVGLSATNVRDGIDELKAYIDSTIAGAGGIFVNQSRAGSNEAIVAGDNTITFSDPFLTADYSLIIQNLGDLGIDEENIIKTVNGFTVNALNPGTLNYIAVAKTSTGADFEADSIGYDDTVTVFGVDNVQDAVEAINSKVETAAGDMTKAVYDPNTVEADAFDMDNMIEGTTNKILTNSQQDINGDKDFKDEISVSERSKSGINSISYSAAISVDFSAGDLHQVATITGNLTINTTNIENGQTGVIELPIDSTGGYTLATGSGTWQIYDNSPYDVPDCNVASTTYHLFYMIISNTIYYSIQAVSP